MTKSALAYTWAEIEYIVMYDQILDKSMFLRDTVISAKNGNWRLVDITTVRAHQFFISAYDIFNRTEDFISDVEFVNYYYLGIGTLNARIKELYKLVEEGLQMKNG